MRGGAEQVLADARRAVRDAEAVGDRSRSDSDLRFARHGSRRRTCRRGARACADHLTLPLIEADRERVARPACSSTPTFFVGDQVLRRRRRERSRRRSTPHSAKPAGEEADELTAVRFPCSSATARSRSWRAARRSSHRIANRSFSARSARGAAFALAIAIGERRERDRSRPLLWMHAPSVGEGLQARPVLELARSRRRDTAARLHVLFAERGRASRASLDVDFRDYLPFDTPGDARVALDALRPTALVFSKLDVWPVITREAQARGVRLGLISATLSRGSSRRSRTASRAAARRVRGARGRRRDRRRRRRPARAARRALERRSSSRATRDTIRCGSARSASIAPSPMLARLRATRPTIVAGSTWPADEAVLLPAFEALRAQRCRRAADHRAARADGAITSRASSTWASAPKLDVARLDEPRRRPTPTSSSIDRVGVLGELYALADVAFVGGGFHSAGLHSVLEPAAFGAPVLFGPRHEASRDAALLAQRGGGAAVANEAELCAPPPNCGSTDAAARREAGRLRARARAQRCRRRRAVVRAGRSTDAVRA